jgi:signal transduction histidine kinase
VNTGSVIATAAGWAAGGGAAAWLVTLPLHRRSLVGLLASVVFTGTAASVAAVIGSLHAMFISTNELAAVTAVSIAAGLVAAISAAVAARRLTRDSRALHDAVTAIGRGQVPDAGGRPLATQLQQLHRDLADTAQHLADSRERERALEGSRRDLVAWVSHDLRTPLAGLRARSEALEDGVADDPELYYKQIHAQADRLAAMVDDLFDLSRMLAGSFALDIEPVPLSDLLSDCLAALDPLARAHGVQLCGRSDGTMTVAANAAELNRAFTNLIANAVRHTDAGGLVDVRLHADADQAEVTVRDGCGGIPDDVMGRVFDVGFRGEQARTPPFGERGGAGLGLAITRGIVEAHAGTVDAHNVDGGCVFRVRLPPS